MNQRTTTAAITPAGVRGKRRRRELVATSILAVIVFGLFCLNMSVGSYGLPVLDVVKSVLFISDDQAVDFIVREIRLPVASAALATGLALGLSGIVFQKLLANPLASPDFVGVAEGASLAAVLSIVLFQAGAVVVSVAALGGALTSAILIYLLAWRKGISGYRFILIGIGVSEFFSAMVGYVLSRSELMDARQAMAWLVGSVGQAGALQLRILLGALVVFVPLAMVLGRWLSALELGDDTASALGVRVESARLGLLAIAIVLVALSTATVGPLAFVALIAGPIAERVLRTGGPVLLPAALIGATLVLAADMVATSVLPVELPTGVVTGAIGAPYLIWLLATVNSRGRGG